MKHQRAVWSLIVASLVVFVVVPDNLSQVRRRNLREYKQGPSYILQNEFFLGQGNKEKAALRQFLWELWSTRSQGFCNVTFYSREGDSTKCKFFVEQNEMGQWLVVSECQSSVCPFTSKVRCRKYLKKVHTTSYNLVRRIRYGDIVVTSSGPKRPQRQIVDDEASSPLDFVLVLKSSFSGSIKEL